MMEMPEDSLLLSYLECFVYQKDRGQCLEMNIVSPSLPYHPKQQDCVISYFLWCCLFARMSCLPGKSRYVTLQELQYFRPKKDNISNFCPHLVVGIYEIIFFIFSTAEEKHWKQLFSWWIMTAISKEISTSLRSP